MFAQSSSQGSYLPMQPFGQPPIHQSVDVNSPEVFKQNMQAIGQQVSQVQNLISNILLGVQNAYHSGHTPNQAEADIATLKQLIHILIENLRQSGVGALPLLPLPPSTPAGNTPMPEPQVPTEQQLMNFTSQCINALYQRQSRMQQSATVPADWIDPQRPDLGRL